MDIQITNDGATVTVALNGRLDTLQATECDARLAPVRENADKNIVMECKGLEYISSSGLRIFLGLQKNVKAKGGTLVLRNVNDEICNIFTITGFHKIFVIE